MKKLLCLIFCLVITQKIVTLPLTIGNVTQYPIRFHVKLKNSDKELFINPQDRWTYPLNKEDNFISITWKDYMSNDTFLVDVKKQMPSMTTGGILVIFNKGRFLYDDKTSNVKSGNAEIIKSQ